MNNKKSNNNIIFQRIKNTIYQNKEKKIVVVQKRKKKKGNYIIGETIGEGAFAKVKLAKHIYTGEKVAIKILNKEKIYSNIKKIKKEITILQRLKHKNIIQLYEIMETNKNLYIVMEYCEGKELFNYISKKKHLTELEACRYFQQIIDGVEYLHLSNITHRDLKPENLLLDNKKRILISDFGLSIISQNYNTLLSTPCGTATYSPPEMLSGKKYNGNFSDIWSCGIILYAMLVGNLPYSESKEDLIYQNILTHNFYYPENLSDDAVDLIEHLLKINPEERFNFDEIKAHPWFNLINPKLRPGIIFGIHKIPIDDKILEKVKEYGFDPKKVEESVVNYKYDSFSAIYYLILNQFKKKGINSVSDLFSDDFLNYLKNSKNWINPSKINDPLFKDYEIELLDNLGDVEYEDEMLWIPQLDSPCDLSNTNIQDENVNINEKPKNNNNNKYDQLNNNIIDKEDFENDFNNNVITSQNNDKTIDNNKNIEDNPTNSNDMNNNIKNLDDKEQISPRNINYNINRKIKNNIQNKNIKKNKKRISNLKNKSQTNDIIVKNNTHSKNKSCKINKNSCKSVVINNPETTKTPKTIYSNKNIKIYEQKIFDNLNEFEIESKIISQNSEILTESEKKLFFNGKEEESKENNINKNKIKNEVPPIMKINSTALEKRNYKSDLSDLICNTKKSRKSFVTNINIDDYKIKIKKANKRKNENEDGILLSEELTQSKKEKILNKLKEEEKKFNEELNLIDNISSGNQNINTINNNNCKEKNIIGQIGEKLIKTTIFSQYLIGNKKLKNSLKADLENKFYILQKYKKIIGLIERMRNKIFTKKLNDFNFYTFDEYLNDKNDKMFTNALLSIPYFNSFIEKAKNILYQKEALTKRAYSKNYLLKRNKTNMNNNYILTPHLSSNINNIFAYNYPEPKNNNNLNNFKKLNVKNLTFTPDNNIKSRCYIESKNKHSNTKNKFYLYKKIPNTTIREDVTHSKYNINRKNYFSADRYSKKLEIKKKYNKSYNYNYNSVNRFKNIIDKRLERTTNNLTSYNKKIINKKNINDISENEDSISSFSLNEEDIANNTNKINIIVNKKNIYNKNITQNKFVNNKSKKLLEEEKINEENKKGRAPKKNSNFITMSPYNNKENINAQILNEKNQKENKIEGGKIINNIKINENNNNKNSKKCINNEILKELKEFIPIDLFYIINLPVNIIIQRTKKYLKKNGYYCNDKNNIIKGNKGISNIEITLYKLKYLKNDNVYFSVKIKNLESKDEKNFIREMINNLKK